MTKKGKVVLSLAVREKLMRGRYDEAVELLTIEYKIEKPIAERFIEAYRIELRERKNELEVLKMQRQNQQEEEIEKQKYIRYAAWAVAVAVSIVLLWMLMKVLAK